VGNLIDIDLVKDELHFDSTVGDTYDGLLENLVSIIESLWDELTNRIWAKTSHIEYYNSSRYNNIINLRNFPVQSVTSIYDDPDRDFEAGDLVDADDYSVDTKNGIIYNDGMFYEGFQSLKVTYVAGYTDVAGTGNLPVPMWLKGILIRQAAHWYRQGVSQNWDVSSVDNRAGGTTSYKQLKDNLLPDFWLMVDKHKR
jgi:hypothetical protein